MLATKNLHAPSSTVCRLLLCVAVFAALSHVGCDSRVEFGVESEPSGAKVYRDGELIGETPTRVEVTRGTTAVSITLPGVEAGSDDSAEAPEIGRPLTCAYLPLTANLPLFVALENGYFKRYGVEVNAIEATSPNDIVTGIASGEVDFAAVLAYTIIFPATNRFPDAFRLYSSSEETVDRYTASIITLKDSPIDSYEDLRGKKIGVYTGLVQINFLKAMLAGMGMDESDVEIVEISPRLQIQGLVSGQYDALSSTEPTVNIARLQGIAKVVVANPRVRYIMNPFPSTAATISTKLIEEDPRAAEAVVRALADAVDFINRHPDIAEKTLPEYTPIPKDLADDVLADLKLFRYCRLGEENRLNVQRFADYMHDVGLLKEKIDDVNRLFGDYHEVRTDR